MQDLHWRYNFNTSQFDFVENNPNQHYEPLLKHVSVPTLVIDINLVRAHELGDYLERVLHLALENKIKFDQIIFDGTQDPVTEYDLKTKTLDDFGRSYGIKCFFALSQFDLNTHPHLIEINYPSWLFVFKRQSRIEFSNHDRSKAFSCLNRNPSFHRLIFYTMIKQRGLLDKFIYSFYDRCPYQGHLVNPSQYRMLEQYIDRNLAQSCLANLQDFPISWHGETLGENDHSVKHPAYQDAWCNIVTETSATVSFTSEKIWKPMAAGQMFLVVGFPGTTAWLKKLGFHVFDDHYDAETDLANRLTSIVDLIQQHQDDAGSWWKANRFHIEHNYHWLHSGNVEKNLLYPIVNQLNHK